MGRTRPEPFMFVSLPRRQRPSLRWACPLLFGLLWLAAGAWYACVRMIVVLLLFV